jgi:ribonuclease HII
MARPAVTTTAGRRPAAADRHATAASLFTTNGRTRLYPGARERLDPDFTEETVLWQRGHRLVAGIDEVGRGCLAGPVVAGAVILPRDWIPDGLRDSKLLDAPARERLAAEIRSRAIAWAVAPVSAELIDRLNILWATVLASMLAASRLSVRPDALLLDGGLPLPAISIPQRTVIDADRLCASVAAASVVAKVARDRFMVSMDERYPGYGFASHKGYTCQEHREAILALGASPLHRRSFGILGGVPPVDQLDLWED